MAEGRIRKTVELKAGEHTVVELGELQPGEQIRGYVKDAEHDAFLFMIVDEPNLKRFLEGEEEYEEDDEGLDVLEEGDGKGHYRIDTPVGKAGNYHLILESTAVRLKRQITINLVVSKEQAPE